MGMIKSIQLWFLRLFPYVRELEQAKVMLEALALADPLTRLLNRRAFHEVFARGLALLARNIPPTPSHVSERRQLPSVSLMVIDIDHFKSINDTYGHPAGDAILVELARCIRLHLGQRPIDIVARSGGEEFWVVWPTVGAKVALEKARDFCQVVAATPMSIPSARGEAIITSITVSIGIATIDVTERLQATEAFQKLNAKADRALYWVKRHGRNQAAHSGSMPDEG